MTRHLIHTLVLANLLVAALGASLLKDRGRSPQFQEGDFSLTLVAKKCVFVLATGHSGSTALMDALNQIPNYLIRGEQHGALWNVYESYMNYKWTTEEITQQAFNWTAYENAPLERVKALYHHVAPYKKLRWFNEFSVQRILSAARAYYAILYGYYGPRFVSGFKDSKYVCGKSFSPGKCTEMFNSFMPFLQGLCLDSKVLFNTRASSSLESNWKLYDMNRGQSQEEFLNCLNETHALYDSYVEKNPNHSLRVYYEDMFDPAKNETLAKRILEILDEDPATPIRFDRMPPS